MDLFQREHREILAEIVVWQIGRIQFRIQISF